MREDCIQVDELLRQLADYKNDYADMAAVKLLKKCSTSWEAFKYLQDRVHDPWIPESARHCCELQSHIYEAAYWRRS